ncbi:YesL family protein [Microbacterium sp. NPDC019599]|uniref:YesL family protein n=1 Tax=Microbacterium sp. NPDC019599 TaxID=3154690 RepID=UPI0033F17569
MSSIFAQDSPLMRFLTRIADLMILNLIFIATSIPIVTLGAALTALNFTAMRLVRGKEESVTRDYFRSFRQNFRQATILGLGMLLLIAVFYAWFVVVTDLAPEGLARLVLLALWYLVAFGFALNLIWVFPYLATFEGTLREVLSTSRKLSWKHPFTSFAVAAIIALTVIVTVFSPQATGFGLLWLLIGFAGVAFITGVLFSRVFAKYAPELAPAEEPDEE